MKRCVSCGRNTKNFAEIPCPVCSESIVRCYDCRKSKNSYACKCGFEGP